MGKRAVVLVNPMSTPLAAADHARDLGYHVIGLITLPQTYWLNVPAPYIPPYAKPWEKNTFFDETVIESDVDKAEWILRNLDMEICGVIAGSEMGVIVADELAARFGLPGNDPRFSTARRDKALMKEAVAAAGLRVAKHFRCRKFSDVEEAMTQMDFPVVIKTPNGTGTRNVFICESLDELQTGFDQILSTDSSTGEIPNFALLEEYIGGTEYVVDLFGNGQDLVVTDVWRYRKGDTKYAKNLYLDTILEPNDSRLLGPLYDYAIKASQALGISCGGVHGEFKIDPDKGPVLIEIGSRLGGLRMPVMCAKHSDFNPIRNAVLSATNQPVPADRNPKFKKWCWIVTIPSEANGLITEFQGVDAIRKLSSYDSHFLPLKEGEITTPSVDLWDTSMIVWLANEDREALAQDAYRAHKLFKIKTREPVDSMTTHVESVRA